MRDSKIKADIEKWLAHKALLEKVRASVYFEEAVAHLKARHISRQYDTEGGWRTIKPVVSLVAVDTGGELARKLFPTSVRNAVATQLVDDFEKDIGWEDYKLRRQEEIKKLLDQYEENMRARDEIFGISRSDKSK